MTVSGAIFAELKASPLILTLVSLPSSFSVWLASPEARFLKGKFLWANWDVDELKAEAKELEAGTRLNIGLGGWPFEGPEWNFQPVGGTWST